MGPEIAQIVTFVLKGYHLLSQRNSRNVCSIIEYNFRGSQETVGIYITVFISS